MKKGKELMSVKVRGQQNQNLLYLASCAAVIDIEEA